MRLRVSVPPSVLFPFFVLLCPHCDGHTYSLCAGSRFYSREYGYKLSGSDKTLTSPTVNQAVLFFTFRINSLPTLETLVAFKPSPNPHNDTLLLSDLKPPRANATFVILCRNSELDGVIQSVQSVEDRFNRDYGYPYVFLNEEPFNDEFIRYAPLGSLKCVVLSYRK